MKDNKFIKFITSKYLILAVQLFATALFTYLIFQLDLVPLKYLIPATGALGLLIIIFFFIMRSGQKKINQGLGNLQKNGELRKLNEKWFGQDSNYLGPDNAK